MSQRLSRIQLVFIEIDCRPHDVVDVTMSRAQNDVKSWHSTPTRCKLVKFNKEPHETYPSARNPDPFGRRSLRRRLRPRLPEEHDDHLPERSGSPGPLQGAARPERALYRGRERPQG